MDAEKKKKIIVIIIFAAAVLLAAYLWWRKKQQNVMATDVIDPIIPVKPIISSTSNNNNGSVKTKVPSHGNALPSTKFPLVPGSKGKEVKQLQAYLLSKYGLQFPSGIDGVWGDETSRNVKKALNLGGVAESTFKNLGIDKIKV